MGTQGPGRRRIPNREKLTAEEDALSQIVREAEARLAAKRAARAEAREIRMKELERQQKELFHSHKKYYGLDYKWGHIEQWMEDSERCSGLSRRHTSISDDEERMSVGSRGSLRPSDYGVLLGSGSRASGSRASSRASSARASPVVEERPDRDFIDKGSKTASTLSAATLASLGGASPRRGSCDTSVSVETEASIREMKDSLVEAEEKYRRAMVSNAQLHNEKTTLMFQVDTLREELSDLEELLWEARRRGETSEKELERERHTHRVLQVQFTEMKETLRRTEELLTALERQREISDIIQIERDRLKVEVVRLQDLLKKHGVIVSPEIATNGESELSEDDVSAESASRLAEESLPGDKEEMLGETPELQPVEGSKYLQDHFQPNHWRVSKPASEQTEQTRERQNPTNKNSERNKSTRNKQPRYKGGEKDLFPTRVHRNPLKNEGLQKQPLKNEAEYLTQASDQGCKATAGPGSELDSFGVMEIENSKKMGKCNKMFLPVGKTFAEKSLRSRLVPPRPAKDIILDNRAIVLSLLAAGKLSSPSEKKQKLHDSGVLEKEASSSDTDFEQKRRFALDLSSQRQQDRNLSSSDRYSRVDSSEEEFKMHNIINQTLSNSMKVKESVDRFVVTEEQGLKNAAEIVTSKVKTGVSERQRSETQLVHPSLPESSPTSEKLYDQRIYEPVQAEACPECPESKKSSVPEEMWTGLEKTVRDMLQGLANKPGFVVEISRIFSEILMSLHRWMLDLENLRSTSTGNESSLCDGSESVGQGFLRKLHQTNKNQETETEGPGSSASIQVSSASGRMEELSGSKHKVYPAIQDQNNGEETMSRKQSAKSFLEDEFGASPAEKTDSHGIKSSEEVVFIDSHFAEPFNVRMESRSDLGLRDSLSKKPEGHLGKDPKDLRTQMSSSNSNAGQSSAVKRLIEMTAEELRAIAVPELALLSLQEGKRLEESSGGPLEEVSARDMDSCEEADEEEEKDILQQAAEQQTVAGMEAVGGAIRPAASIQKPDEKPEGVRLDQRKDENTDCRVS
ncbi:uncharacterized protein LOC108228457 isoform X2 [Kryptolebias marmoratus]|uniref:uncharacterized protein LOC108228457 isoform X2 n=1 Tax=Kryptolebias marmoratus TaxID=37003 RepID=UPI0018ACCE17|nr:uncharacterized protein LOC108228457 isoform X2 [Kryptolebias marmoratus]